MCIFCARFRRFNLKTLDFHNFPHKFSFECIFVVVVGWSMCWKLCLYDLLALAMVVCGVQFEPFFIKTKALHFIHTIYLAQL